jgi:uncharacterized damage-inducible protein DinB
MEHTLASYYRCWFQYEKDSHAKVLAALQAVPESRRSSAEFRKAVALMAHIVAARELWLFRLGAIAEGPGELVPDRVSLAEVADQLEAVEAAWSGYLENLEDAQLPHPVRYRSTEGPWFKSTIADILTQLFGHSSYHRGQIALLLRSIGAEPPATDYIYWSRQSIAPPEPASGATRTP